MFDLAKIKVSQETNQNRDTGAEGHCDLEVKLAIKNYPNIKVYFGVIFEHKTKVLTPKTSVDAFRQLRGYCLRKMDHTDGFTVGILFNQGNKPVKTRTNYLDHRLAGQLPPCIEQPA